MCSPRVETAEQLDYLVQQGCDYLQGHYFSEPLPQDEILPFLHRAGLVDLPEETAAQAVRPKHDTGVKH